MAYSSSPGGELKIRANACPENWSTRHRALDCLRRSPVVKAHSCFITLQISNTQTCEIFSKQILLCCFHFRQISRPVNLLNSLEQTSPMRETRGAYQIPKKQRCLWMHLSEVHTYDRRMVALSRTPHLREAGAEQQAFPVAEGPH